MLSRYTGGSDSVKRRFLLTLAGILGCGSTSRLLANPEGLTVASGSASVQQQGTSLNLTVSQGAVLNWQHFNIKPGETTTFHQPNSASIVWNRILDANPSQIWGNLNANGYVVLFNQNGFYFGPNSVVNVGGLVVTTAPVMSGDFASGGIWQFSGMPPAASIINYGQVKASSGGSLFLIAEKIENHGVLMAPDGNIGLYAGKEVLVSQSPDGRGLSARVTLPEGSIDNRGQIVADAGTIAFHAEVVNQGGLVQANSIRERNGVIELIASDRITLEPNSQLAAEGDAAGVSPGGRITLKTDGVFSGAASSSLRVGGGHQGGDGGRVEVSASRFSTFQTQIEGQAAAGWKGGELLLDPQDIILGNSGDGAPSGGSVDSGDSPASGALQLNVHSAFVGFSHITLQATRDISLADNTLFNLAESTGLDESGATLSLQAGRNIVFGKNSSIQGSQNWSVQLAAGSEFSNPANVRSGVGGIYLNGGVGKKNTGSIETGKGSISMFAGSEILLGGGFIRTAAGGSIQLSALSGDVDAGTKADGFDFKTSGYQISDRGLGGIGTAAGGNVNIDAGRDILSTAPAVGAYGAESGDVTLHAGARVLGNFLVRNGKGLMTAGLARDGFQWSVRNVSGDIGSSVSPVTLNLISGSWEARGARDVYINEVRNPNGTLNPNKPAAVFNGTALMFNGQPLVGADRPPNYYFDYALDASVTLDGGNSVQLLGANLSRPGNGNSVPIVYPPRLDITAGSGGVLLGNDVILYPSSVGNLHLSTHDGGSLRSAAGSFHQLVLSDSGSARYSTFAEGHATTPLHIADPEAVEIAVAGNLENLFLRLPKRSHIRVAGNAYNASLESQNLSQTDVSTLKVGGDFSTRLDRSFVTLSDDADLSSFDLAYTLNSALAARISYNPLTRRFGYIGRMTEADRDFLLSPQVRVLDAYGLPVLDEAGNPVAVFKPFTRDVAAIQQLFLESQSVPTSSLAYRGLQLGGPGNFSIEAGNLSLGISQGIRSVGTLLNPSLGLISSLGADISIQVHENLDLTSSQIASFSGGSIDIAAGGSINVGSQEQFTGDDTPKGILTTSGGAVSVTARGDVNVNGSRIATYNGGNVTVQSIEGDVDAGKGGLGSVVVYRTFIDPLTGVASIGSSTIPGSGILATTLRGSSAQLGDIAVEAGRDILASRGGVFQLSFSGLRSPSAAVSLKAGRDILAKDSGVVGGNVSLIAGRNTEAIVVARGSLNIQSVQSANVVALASGGISLSAGGSVSGTLVSGTGISASGGEGISANLISQNVHSSSQTSGEVGVTQTTAARSDSKASLDASQTLASNDKDLKKDEEEWKKKSSSSPVLKRSAGRVTVILSQN